MVVRARAFGYRPAMLKSVAKRMRYETFLRLNRLRPSPKYRFVDRQVGDRHRVILHDHGRERVLDLRAGTSDFMLFRLTFEWPQYDIRNLSRHSDVERCYASILEQGRRPLIVDAGANNGLSALYFRDRYPEAAIIAIEPEVGNFAELERLMGDDPLCLCVNAAIATFEGHVEIENPGLTECGYRTKQSAGGIPAYRLETAVEMAPWPVDPFILKIDIEGFEKDLFDDPSTLDSFYLAFVELHDWMLPKQRTAKSFLKASAELNRDFVLHGENVVSIKID